MGRVLIHTSNQIFDEPNTSKEVIINFNTLVKYLGKFLRGMLFIVLCKGFTKSDHILAKPSTVPSSSWGSQSPFTEGDRGIRYFLGPIFKVFLRSRSRF